MRNRTQWILLGIILVSIVALAGTSLGIALAVNSTRIGGPPPAAALQSQPDIGATHVYIRNYTYQPANIEVVLGTAISWTNQDSAIHSVVLPYIIDSETDIRESGPLGQGQSFRYTFMARGTFQYYCTEHTDMIGIVTVT